MVLMFMELVLYQVCSNQFWAISVMHDMRFYNVSFHSWYV